MSLKVWLPLNGNLENKGCGNATITGNLTYVDGGKLGKARSAGAITISKDYMTEEGTMCFWINVGPETITAAGGQIYKSPQTHGRKWDLFLYSTKNDFHSWGCVSDENTSSPNGYWTLNGFFPNDTWIHVAVAHTKGKTSIYRNGTLYHTVTWNSTGTFTFEGPVVFGSTTEGILYNDLRIYDECLTAKQIYEISKGLTLHYTMDRGIGNPNILIDTNKGKTKWNDNMANGAVTMSSVEENGISCFKADRTEVSTSWQYTQYTITSAILNTLTPDTEYTVSLDFKSNVAFTDIRAMISQGDAKNTMTNQVGGRNYDGSQRWQKLTFTIKTIADFSTITIGSQVLYLSGFNKVGWYMIKNLKLEKGTIASQWCPNVNDALYKEMKYDSLIEKDVSGNGYHGTYSKLPIPTSDTPKYSGASYFDNTTYLKGPTLKPEHITISFWTKESVRFGNWEGGGLGLYYSSGWMIEAYINGGYKQAKETTASTLGTWQMITGTWDGRYLKIYVNGDLKTTTDVGEYKLGYNATAPWVLNGNPSADGSAVYDSFASHWSDARIYSTALSADDIKELYNAAAYIDKDGSLRTYALVESGNENLFEGAYTGGGQVSPGAYTRETIDCPESITGTARKITCTTAGNGFYESGTVWNNTKAKMVHGQQYVWSLYCKSDNITSMKFSVECASAQDRTTFTIGPEYRKLSNVFTYSSETTYSAFTSYTKYVEGDNVYIHSFKVQPYNPNLEIMKTGVYKENCLNEGIENQFTIFKQDTETKEIIEI